MENLHISDVVLRKLETKHGVELADVRQCFLNRKGKLLLDTQALTKTDPPTLWFISKTNKKRFLKVVYILKDAKIILKTAANRMKRSWLFMRAMAWRDDSFELQE